MSHCCNICDYRETQGSGLSGSGPGKQGKVRWVVSEFLCTECIDAIRDNYSSLCIGDDLNVGDDTSAMPESDV